MSEEQIALARRVVACRGWRWMPGMSIGGLFLSSVSGLGFAPYGRVLNVRDDDGMQMVSASEYPYDDYGVPEYRWAELTHIPDLTDPATLGCLLALVREAMGDQNICVCWDFVSNMWVCEGAFEYNGNKYLGLIKEAQSYAEALVLTLEDAPCGQ